MKNTDVMKRLRGPKNTEVRVKVLRQGVPDLIEFKTHAGRFRCTALTLPTWQIRRPATSN